MHTSSPRRARLQEGLTRLQGGDLSARDQILDSAWDDISCLARRMFHRFPRLHFRLEADDVRQQAALRLWRALAKLHPASPAGLLGLARTQFRRVLLDLVRHFADAGLAVQADSGQLLAELPDNTADSDDLEEWTQLHALVDGLPVAERQVVSLLLYHGWSQCQAAEVLGVTVRTIQRYWHHACQQLQSGLKQEGPPQSDGMLGVP